MTRAGCRKCRSGVVEGRHIRMPEMAVELTIWLDDHLPEKAKILPAGPVKRSGTRNGDSLVKILKEAGGTIKIVLRTGLQETAFRILGANTSEVRNAINGFVESNNRRSHKGRRYSIIDEIK